MMSEPLNCTLRELKLTFLKSRSMSQQATSVLSCTSEAQLQRAMEAGRMELAFKEIFSSNCCSKVERDLLPGQRESVG